MRKLSLKALHLELLRISMNRPPVNPRFQALLNEVRRDLKKAEEWQYMDVEDERPLSHWWSSYSGLADYIRK